MTVISYVNSFIQSFISRLTPYAEEIIRDYQSGFRLGLTDQVVMRHLFCFR